jgi:hypothetical protein
VVTGVAWYTSSEWARVKATAVDPERFEASFDDWVAMAEKALVDLRKAGLAAQKCLISANELGNWCAEKGVENDAAGRARFVSEKLNSTSHAGGG